MEVAAAQLEVIAGSVAENRAAAVEAVETAAQQGADLVVLPEQFAVGFFAFDAYEETAEPIGGETHSRLAAVAEAHDIAILAGTIVEDLGATARETHFTVPAEEGLANTSVLIDADGTYRAVYRKTHLWGYDSKEAELLVPGSELGVTPLGDFTVGITTCYDLRFPELYRRLVDAGVDMVLVPSAWPFPRVEHWRTLTRARAIENLTYVIAVNGTGTMYGERLCGRSTVYDPWGTVVGSAGDEPDVFTSTVDPRRVEEVRAEFPALRDRRERFGPG